jgi:hypothetical protein
MKGYKIANDSANNREEPKIAKMKNIMSGKKSKNQIYNNAW